MAFYSVRSNEVVRRCSVCELLFASTSDFIFSSQFKSQLIFFRAIERYPPRRDSMRCVQFETIFGIVLEDDNGQGAPGGNQGFGGNQSDDQEEDE